MIEYSLATAGSVHIQVTNLAGNPVATLVDERKAAGLHDVEFKAAGLPSGIYFYTLTAGDYTLTRKMVLVR